jgi:protocadherin Fat 1/2/3
MLFRANLQHSILLVIFFFRSSSSSFRFAAACFTGETPARLLIINVRSPDHEMESTYSIDALSTDACPYGPRSRTVRVDISIVDVNDNAPKFTQNIYSTDIAVDFPVGGTVVTVAATDADSATNALVSYSLANASQYFQVNCPASELSVSPRRVLTRVKDA